MPTIKEWKFELFPSDNTFTERIDFSIDDHNFLMVFTPFKNSFNEEYFLWLSENIGFDIPDDGYVIKFDRVENFETGDFFARPSDDFSKFDLKKLNRLGKAIKEIIEFHCSLKNTEIYYASAQDFKMKKYYDRLIKKYSKYLNFEILSNLGEERLDYVIKTRNYKDQSQKD